MLNVKTTQLLMSSCTCLCCSLQQAFAVLGTLWIGNSGYFVPASFCCKRCCTPACEKGHCADFVADNVGA